jgi:N-acetyl-alpha-D-glucosaminyl L-malate synthase BshA
VEYDRARWKPDLREAIPAGHKVLMHVSNFRAVKRVRDIIRIFATVRKAMPATLVMVGDGPDRGDAAEEARALGVERDVRFLGRIVHVAPLLASADLFLLPSETESFGLSALEALASGVPVVASRVGGIPEVIRDGETGALRDVGDVDGMAASAIDLLADESRWRTTSRAAAADARERFALEKILAQYVALYEEAQR